MARFPLLSFPLPLDDSPSSCRPLLGLCYPFLSSCQFYPLHIPSWTLASDTCTRFCRVTSWLLNGTSWNPYSSLFIAFNLCLAQVMPFGLSSFDWLIVFDGGCCRGSAPLVATLFWDQASTRLCSLSLWLFLQKPETTQDIVSMVFPKDQLPITRE